MLDNNLIQQMFAQFNHLIDYKMSQQTIIRSAIVHSINPNGTVNIYIPPNNTIYHNIQNQSIYRNLAPGDSVKIIVENGNLSSMWIIGGFNLSINENNNSNKQSITLDDVYPVGSIYLSMDNKNPEILFGGIWQQLQDRFLLGAGDDYVAGTIGGEKMHTLTINELPTHTHEISVASTNTGNNSASNTIRFNNNDTSFVDSVVAQNTGNGIEHNNMPPYLVVYMWQRVK